MPLEKFSRILIVNPYGIGDVLFTTPLIRKVRQAFGHCYLACLLGSRTREILEKNPNVDEIFIFDKGKFDKSSLNIRFKMLFSLLSVLRKRHFDLMFDISNAPEYSLFAKVFLRIKTRVGFDYKKRGRFLTHRLKLTGYQDKHIIEYYMDLARFLGIPQTIIDKPPSAGLWEGQTDEGEMGFSYEALDRYLLNGDASDELRSKIEAMIAASSHKRSMPPIAHF